MKKIFRDKALEKLSNPEELEGAVQIINVKSWILLLLFILITFAIFFWMGFNTINQQVKSKGIIIKPNSLTIIHSLSNGFIENISINNSNSIKKGDYLFNLIPIETKNKIAELEKEVLFYRNGAKSGVKVETLLKAIKDLKESSAVYSQVDGTIFELNVSEGDFVNTGDKLLSIDKNIDDLKNADKNLSVIGLVPAESINSLKIGNKVLIAPHNIDVKEFGYMRGSLVKIANYPVSFERKKMLSKENPLLGNILQNEFYEIHVNPLLNSEGGFLWTSGKGMSIDFIRASYCEISIITESKSLMSFIIK